MWTRTQTGGWIVERVDPWSGGDDSDGHTNPAGREYKITGEQKASLDPDDDHRVTSLYALYAADDRQLLAFELPVPCNGSP